MFRFVKQVFLTGMIFFSCNLLNVNSLECVSMNNQECKTRKKINTNNNEPVFYPFSIKVNKCSGSCNNINDPYAKLCVPDAVKNIIAKVFKLISFTNQTKHIEWHETYKYKCRLDSSVCNNINDPYAKLCVPDFAENINVKVFNLISFTNQTKHI